MDKALKARLRKRFGKGTLFEGKYRIKGHIGTGSFAYVMKAKHEAMERSVAIKVLKPELVNANPELLERFVNEVKIVAKLKHPNTVTVFDYGHTDDDIHYLVMEYVDGQPLDEVIAEQGALSPYRAVTLTRQMLKSLAEAHSFGIVHRDLKPSNIMLTHTHDEQEVVKVLDFGVAKLVERRPQKRNSFERRSTQFVGTPMYMSPEQVLGQDVVPASDLYSLGLILYEMLTGEDPMRKSTVAEIAQHHIDPAALPFPSLHTLTERFQKLILRATSRDVDDRFGDVGSFARALPALAEADFSGEFSKLLTDDILEKPAGLESVSESSWEIFSGKNYVAPPDSTAEDIKVPREPKKRRPEPAQPKHVAEEKKKPRRARPGGVELDVANIQRDEWRKRREQRLAQQGTAVVRRDYVGISWVIGGLCSAYVSFIIASSVYVSGDGADRWFIGLLPVGAALLWSQFAGIKRHHGALFERTIVPIAKHMVFTTLALLLFTALVTPEAAASRMENVGGWFLEDIHEESAFRIVRTLTMLLTSLLGALFSFFSHIVPW